MNSRSYSGGKGRCSSVTTSVTTTSFWLGQADATDHSRSKFQEQRSVQLTIWWRNEGSLCLMVSTRQPAGGKMPHDVDGYELKYVSRTSWKAERRSAGKLLDVVPVTWTDGWRQDPSTKDRFLPVWFKDRSEMEKQRTNAVPFVVAVAEARDKTAQP